jgi:hypothetical protein
MGDMRYETKKARDKKRERSEFRILNSGLIKNVNMTFGS